MKLRFVVLALVGVFASSNLAFAQLGKLGSIAKKGEEVKKATDDLYFTPAEENQLGTEISAKLREKYGVVQDKPVHKYVTLVGAVLASASKKPNLNWTFIVLDTDGVNAFAAPGGYIHITRGALALIQNESELAGVLGHEISHVTLQHTINAINKSKRVGALTQAGAKAARADILKDFANAAYENLLENKYDRNDEMGADSLGIQLANGAGYAPDGLGGFLTRLSDRNKGLKDASGIFASHPETTARLDALKKLIVSGKLTAAAKVAARYGQSITFKPVPVTQVAQVDSSAPAAKPAEKPADKPSTLSRIAGGSSKENSSNQTVSSAGSRGVNPDRDAKGGPVKTAVAVTVTAAEIDAFKKGING